MFFKRTVTFFLMVIFLSMFLLVHSSCAKSGEKTEGAGQKVERDVQEKGDKLTEKTKNPVVLMKTSMGDIKIELFPNEAPVSVKNFLDYVKDRFYEGTIFHRVIQNFMIQGGGFAADLSKKPTLAPIKNEATNMLSNKEGTVAMARTQVVDSATSQFYINLKDNNFLDHKGESPSGYGYCVFGKVIQGMDVVQKIGKVQTTTKDQYRDMPITPVEIKSVQLLTGGGK